jgi:hypothetical protein
MYQHRYLLLISGVEENPLPLWVFSSTAGFVDRAPRPVLCTLAHLHTCTPYLFICPYYFIQDRYVDVITKSG